VAVYGCGKGGRVEVLLLENLQHLFVETFAEIGSLNNCRGGTKTRIKIVKVLDGKSGLFKTVAQFYQTQGNHAER
jgi:hypothetical protein